eukprot:jgi/Ulvmu1/7792/UM004_0021.1
MFPAVELQCAGMSATRWAQFAQLARSNPQALNLGPLELCASCGRLFAQESSGNGKTPDLKPAGDASQTTKSDPPADEPDSVQKQNERLAAEKAAQSVTASMFPWERRQMDGGSTPLNRFERVYWIAFGGAVIFIVGSNVYRYFTSKKEVKVDEDLAKVKEEMALKLSSGSVNVLQCEDVFEGLSPQEVSEYVDSTHKKRIRERHTQADEYDGLSPEEINRLHQ